jgi:hypothetical protein
LKTTESRLENFELHEDYASLAPVGVVTIEQAVTMVTTAITNARKKGLKHLLVDFLNLKGIRRPVLQERYWIAHEWSREAAEAVSLALILEPQLIDPDRFGVVVAWNLGLRADVFTGVPEALKWLLSGEKPLPWKGD